MNNNEKNIEPHLIDSVIEAENQRIKAHRKNKNIDQNNPLVGLSLSGGGIRSATFAMGVIQALHRKEKLNQVDYLSTVSGGSYIGSSLSWFNYLKANATNKPDWDFPFGEIGKGARNKDADNPLNYIRQHGNYLLPNSELNSISVSANFIRNSVVAGFIYLLLFSFIFFVLEDAGLYKPALLLGVSENPWFNTITLLAIVFFAIFFIASLLYGLYSFVVNMYSGASYIGRYRMQVWQGLLLNLGLGFLVIGSIRPIFLGLEHMMFHIGSGMTLLGGLGSYFEIRKQPLKTKINDEKSSPLKLILITVLVCYGLLLVSYYIAHQLSTEVTISASMQWYHGILFLLLPSLIFGIFVNVNEFGPGRYYRDRLMETFMPDIETIKEGKWRLAREANTTKLSKMCGANESGPYHIVNTNVILADSNDAKFRGRGGDSFILSPLYCGSDSIGWYNTTKFNKGKLTMATAMAISGAALNPYAGVNGAGATRMRLLSIILSFFNIRLGYVATNPSVSGWRGFWARHLAPNFYIPGFYQGLLGQGFNENSAYITLSDGGHFDDSGLYELARRQLDTIIISEAGADPKYTFSDLANAIERIRVDFGYCVDFPLVGGIEDMIPGSDGNAHNDENIAFAKRGYAIGKIYYDAKRSGTIIFIKAVLIKGLPVELYSYKKCNPTFPNETTADQFFSEEQVESYRELGYRLGLSMLNDNSVKI